MCATAADHIDIEIDEPVAGCIFLDADLDVDPSRDPHGWSRMALPEQLLEIAQKKPADAHIKPPAAGTVDAALAVVRELAAAMPGDNNLCDAWWPQQLSGKQKKALWDCR